MPVKGFHRLPYKDLRRLGLHSFNRYRLCGDLIVVDNVRPGGYDLDLSLFFYSAGATRQIQIENYWKRLPNSILTSIAPSINSFKGKLDSALEERFAAVP